MVDDARCAALYPRLLAMARRYAREGQIVEPEDLAHEAWLRTRRAGRLGLPDDELRRYLWAAIHAAAVDGRRKRAPLAGPVADWTPAPGSVEEEVAIRCALAPILALARRDPRVNLLVAYATGIGVAELATRTRRALPAVKSAMHRARRALMA